MITLPEMLQSAIVRFGLTVEFQPEYPPGSTVQITIRDASGYEVARTSVISIDDNTASVISFIEESVHKYPFNRGALNHGDSA